MRGGKQKVGGRRFIFVVTEDVVVAEDGTGVV
jgi:hypothetical protein